MLYHELIVKYGGSLHILHNNYQNVVFFLLSIESLGKKLSIKYLTIIYETKSRSRKNNTRIQTPSFR